MCQALFSTTFPICHSGLWLPHNALCRSIARYNRKVGHRVDLRRHKNIAMLGQAVRRFTTSAVRSSHYAEGPGKVISCFETFCSTINCDVVLSRPCLQL